MKTRVWGGIILGVWLILSPWILGFSSLNLAFWNCVILGSGIILFALWTAVVR